MAPQQRPLPLLSKARAPVALLMATRTAMATNQRVLRPRTAISQSRPQRRTGSSQPRLLRRMGSSQPRPLHLITKERERREGGNPRRDQPQKLVSPGSSRAFCCEKTRTLVFFPKSAKDSPVSPYLFLGEKQRFL